MAQKIKQEYIDEGSEYHVQLDPIIRAGFLEKYRVIEALAEQLEASPDDQIESDQSFDLIIIEVYAFVLDKLRDYFEMFKKSNAFSKSIDTRSPCKFSSLR